MEDIRVLFGHRVKDLRLQRGWSQETLANRADIDRTYLPGIENGKRNVSLIIIHKLASVFNLKLSELFNDL